MIIVNNFVILYAVVVHSSIDGQIGRQCDTDSAFVGQCGNCLTSNQCQAGMFCCPFMKKCVESSSTTCSGPIARCSGCSDDIAKADSCPNCQNNDFPNKWVTCLASSTPPQSQASTTQVSSRNNSRIFKKAFPVIIISKLAEAGEKRCYRNQNTSFSAEICLSIVVK